MLNVNSLSEAEQIIEQWIAEFTLGQQFNKPSYEELLQAENTYEVAMLTSNQMLGRY